MKAKLKKPKLSLKEIHPLIIKEPSPLIIDQIESINYIKLIKQKHFIQYLIKIKNVIPPHLSCEKKTLRMIKNFKKPIKKKSNSMSQKYQKIK